MAGMIAAEWVGHRAYCGRQGCKNHDAFATTTDWPGMLRLSRGWHDYERDGRYWHSTDSEHPDRKPVVILSEHQDLDDIVHGAPIVPGEPSGMKRMETIRPRVGILPEQAVRGPIAMRCRRCRTWNEVADPTPVG